MRTKNIAAFKMGRGDMVSLRTGGGGGWGNAMTRDPERVLWDVKNDYISVEDAKNIYGVIINPSTLEIDLEKTKELREMKGEL